MSSLLEKIRTDWLAARKSRNTIEATLLGTLVGAIQSKQKMYTPARDLSEAEIIAEIKKMFDGVVETGKILVTTNRGTDLEKNALEETILLRYLPQQMTEAEIHDFALQHLSAGLSGIMILLKATFPGKYDGKLASMAVKNALK